MWLPWVPVLPHRRDSARVPSSVWKELSAERAALRFIAAWLGLFAALVSCESSLLGPLLSDGKAAAGKVLFQALAV